MKKIVLTVISAVLSISAFAGTPCKNCGISEGNIIYRCDKVDCGGIYCSKCAPCPECGAGGWFKSSKIIADNRSQQQMDEERQQQKKQDKAAEEAMERMFGGSTAWKVLTGGSNRKEANQENSQSEKSDEKKSENTKKSISYDQALSWSKKRILSFLQDGSSDNFTRKLRKKAALRERSIQLADNLKSVEWGNNFVKNNKMYFTVRLKDKNDNWLLSQYQFVLVGRNQDMLIENIIEITVKGFDFDTGKFEKSAEITRK